MSAAKLALLCACVLALATSCGGPEPEARDRDELFLELAMAIEESCRELDPTFLDEAFTMDVIADRASEGLGDSAAKFQDMIRTQFGRAKPFGAMVCNAIADDGSYCFLRIVHRDDRPHLLFRMLSLGSPTYQEIEVRLGASGRAEAVDVYNYGSGTYFSATVRTAFMQGFANSDPTIAAKLREGESQMLDHLEDLQRLAQFVEEFRIGSA